MRIKISKKKNNSDSGSFTLLTRQNDSNYIEIRGDLGEILR